MDFFAEYTITKLIGDLVSLGTVAGAIWAIVKASKLTPKEARKIEAEASKTEAEAYKTELDIKADIIRLFEDSAEKAVERAFKLEEKIALQDEKLEAQNSKIDILVERIEELECDNLNKDAMIESLTDWAERLVNQIKTVAPDVEPVKMNPPKKVDCKKPKK